MLEELRIRGLGAIDEATLPLGEGFTAVTGETGTGKTMLLTGLALLLGGRGDTGAIGAGRDRLDVDGRFLIGSGSPALRLVEDAGGQVEDGELVLNRTLSREGRSRAVAGGRPVPVSLLGELADELVTVHGQADQRGLLRPSAQRDALDRYAGAPVAEALDAYRSRFDALRALDAELTEVTSQARERAREADDLRAALADIEAVRPKPGEDETLAEQIARLGHVEDLRAAAGMARADLDGDDDRPSAATLVAAARRALDGVTGRDRRLDELAGRLGEAGYLLGDVAAELASYLESLDADPARLQALQERLAAVRGLTRRYAADAAGVVAHGERAATRLAELDADGDRVQALIARRVALLAELSDAVGRLSRRRAAAAERLAAAVGAELRGLAMPNAELRIQCRQRPDPNGLSVGDATVAFGRHGVDEVEFLLAAHRGAGHRPLHRGASGGELSRVMLALEVVLAADEQPATFVFDEVDAGVGGRAAVEIGRRLAALAERAQVLVVTHLPQVAAFADRHLVVTKSEQPDGTVTTVEEVAGERRLEELSRMLGGISDSELARGHAAELLELAAGQAGARQAAAGSAHTA